MKFRFAIALGLFPSMSSPVIAHAQGLVVVRRKAPIAVIAQLAPSVR